MPPTNHRTTGRRTAVVLCNRLPFPLDDGWKIRTYHVVRGLASAADTTVVAFHAGDDPALADFRAHLDSRTEVLTVPPPPAFTPVQLLLGLVTARPVYVWNQRSAALRALIRTLTQRKQFDLAVSELTALYPYLRLFPRGTRRIIDAHNIDSVVLRRYAVTLPGPLRRRYALITARKLERYERTVFTAADLTWVCSEAEREAIAQTAPGARVCVVPNGVNGALLQAHREAPVHPRRLMFCGLMNYHPNVDAVRYFAEHMLPELKRADPGVEFWIVGRSPAQDVLALAEREPAIRVTGRVEDVRTLLATAAVVVVPLRAGGGTRLKILEALAMAKPVVSTSIGMEGLELTPGIDLLTADTPPAFVAAVQRLLQDPASARRIGEHGRATVAERYEWGRVEALLRQSLGW